MFRPDSRSRTFGDDGYKMVMGRRNHSLLTMKVRPTYTIGLIGVLGGCLIVLLSVLAMVHNPSLCSSFVGCRYDYRAWTIPLIVGGTLIVEGVYALWILSSKAEDIIEYRIAH